MAIIVDHVSHIYGEDTAMAVHALKDVSLVIPDGQFIGFKPPHSPKHHEKTLEAKE